jgi:GTP:adenosylcobinamide-phosphate guanylyltransferase
MDGGTEGGMDGGRGKRMRRRQKGILVFHGQHNLSIHILNPRYINFLEICVALSVKLNKIKSPRAGKSREKSENECCASHVSALVWLVLDLNLLKPRLGKVYMPLTFISRRQSL